MDNSLKIDDVIKEIGGKLKNKVSIPIVIGGWAVNLHGHARPTIDFDFMIKEDDFEQTEKTLNEIGYKKTAKSPIFARYQITTENSDYPIVDCLFVNNKTYDKLKKTGTVTNQLGVEFILPAPINIIAMKLHAMQYSDKRTNDFSDIIALIEIHNIDTGKKSEFAVICKKYSTPEMMQKIRDAVSPTEEVNKQPKIKRRFKL